MLRSLDAVRGFEAHTADGRLGVLGDFSFDPHSWTIRHLVIHTRRFLSTQLLVETTSFLRLDITERRVLLRTAATSAEGGLAPAEASIRAEELCMYPISGAMREKGFIDDYLFDDQTWKIGYLVLHKNGRQSTWVVAPAAAVSMNWSDRRGSLRWDPGSQRTMA